MLTVFILLISVETKVDKKHDKRKLEKCLYITIQKTPSVSLKTYSAQRPKKIVEGTPEIVFKGSIQKFF